MQPIMSCKRYAYGPANATATPSSFAALKSFAALPRSSLESLANHL